MYLSLCAGHSSEHQEQAAHTHHLYGNYRSQSPGGVCRQHQGKNPEFSSLTNHSSFIQRLLLILSCRTTE